MKKAKVCTAAIILAALAATPSAHADIDLGTVGAQLDGAQLDGAQLDGAQLDGAQLDGAQLD